MSMRRYTVSDAELVPHSDMTWDVLLATPGQRILAYLIDIALTILTLGIYTIVWLIMAHSGTSGGKNAMGIKVIRASDGAAPGCLAGILMREFIGKFVSSFVFYLGYAWILIDKRHQAWHDKIAETYVVKVESFDSFMRHQRTIQ